jgi:hypothetical protein
MAERALVDRMLPALKARVVEARRLLKALP